MPGASCCLLHGRGLQKFNVLFRLAPTNPSFPPLIITHFMQLMCTNDDYCSIFTGVESSKHKVDGNSDLTQISAPTIFKLVKQYYPNTMSKIGASCTWHPLITQIINIEDSTTLTESFLAPNDDQMAAKAVEWINNGDLDFIFVHFDEVDGVGHSIQFDGYNTRYEREVMEVDALIGKLLDAIMERRNITSEAAANDGKDSEAAADNVVEEWLILLSTDHGGKGTSHGPFNLENRRIPLMVASNSPRVNIGRAPDHLVFDGEGNNIDPGYSHMDIPPTILHFLNDGGNMEGDSQIPSLREMFDGQVFGFNDYERAPPPQYGDDEDVACIPNSASCGCDSVQQSDYRGTVSITSSGLTCQEWDSQLPHSHSRTKENYPGFGLRSNYCRNPDGERLAWCYTTDPDVRWEFCDVPICDTIRSVVESNGNNNGDSDEGTNSLVDDGPDACTSEYMSISSNGTLCGCGDQTKYRGTLDVTSSGVTCQEWDSQTPHNHTRTPQTYTQAGLEGNNYCRNPDRSAGGAWCYTIDPNIRWEYCNVTQCSTLLNTDSEESAASSGGSGSRVVLSSYALIVGMAVIYGLLA